MKFGEIFSLPRELHLFDTMMKDRRLFWIWLLRNYLHYNLYDQAHKLVMKSSFPETASSSQTARYLYYHGRINAIQLDYTESSNNLTQALRKAPQTSAKGFRLTILKILTIVQLLLG